MVHWPARFVSWWIIAVVLMLASAAFGAPSKADVARRKAYDAGIAAYRSQQYDAALVQFNKALPLPEGQRGIGLTLEAMGRKEEAIEAYKKFIAVAPAAMADKVKDAQTRIDNLSGKANGDSSSAGSPSTAPSGAVKVRVVTRPAGATITVVGQPANGTSPAELMLPPGKHRVHAVLAEHEAEEREIDVVAGTPQELNIELVPSRKLGATTPADVSLTGREASPPGPPGKGAATAPMGGSPGGGKTAAAIAPFVTGGVGAAAVVAGVLFGLSAMDQNSDYKKNPTEGGLADAEDAAARSTACLVGGAVLLVATAALFVFSPSSAPPPAKNARNVGPRRSTGGGGLSFEF